MFIHQLRQLLWKNFLIRSRSKVRLLTEIIWPLTLFIILALVRTRVFKDYQKECFTYEKALPSAGSIRFYQSFICTAYNWCFDTPQPVPDYSNDILGYDQLMNDLTNIRNKNDPYLNFKSSEQFLKLGNNSMLSFEDNIFLRSDHFQAIESLSKTTRMLKNMTVGKVASRLSSNNKSERSPQSLICNAHYKGAPRMTPYSFKSKSRINQRMMDYIQELSSNKNDRIDFSSKESEISENCSQIFSQWQNSNSTNERFLFKMAYPFIRGKLIYSPNTTAGFNNVIQIVNETFQDLKQVQNMSDVWLNTKSPQITSELHRLSIEVNDAIQNVTKNCPQIFAYCRNLLESLKQVAEQIAKMEATVMEMDQLANKITTFIDCYDFDKFIGFVNEDEAVNYGMKLLSQNRLWAVIIFDDAKNDSDDELPKHTTYKIRMDKFVVDDTRLLKDAVETSLPRNDPRYGMTKYFTSGFIYLQDMIDRAIIQIQSNKTSDELPQLYVEQLPGPCVYFDGFMFNIGSNLPLFLNLAFVFSCAMIVKSIVHEKEKRLKETMRTMGLGNIVHWVAWFIDSISVLTIACVILPLILYYGAVFEYSDPSVIFVFFFTFCLANVTFSFLISTLFSRANLAAACGAFIYFISFQPYYLLVLGGSVHPWSINILLSLIGNVAFGLGTSYITKFEANRIGAQWSNIASSPVEGDNYSLLACISMLLADAVLYMLVALYIEAVFPGMYGVPKPWYFLFVKAAERNYQEIEGSQENSGWIEEEVESLPVGVSIRNLGKTFSNGKEAVKNLNLNFYQNQITSFLGHNGAGKTTTISILTGLYTATTGTATINGFDIRYQMDDIRQQLGLCPQFNVLFEQLTVLEHLIFYANLKTGKKIESKKEIDKMIDDLGLSHKRDEMSRYLSGGMKRKLSIGAAFIGNSKTVILDEPTAGVDPYSRRSIWEILLKYKEGRTIILTTHFMDEADLLGDRIAIISQGQLKCCGSSLFLKRKFGSGYFLTLVRKDRYNTSAEEDQSNNTDSKISLNQALDGTLSSSINIGTTQTIHHLLEQHIPNHAFVEDVGSDLVVCLPEFSQEGLDQRSKFPALLQEIESKMDHFGLDSYGVSNTTLEEIFLKIVDDSSSSDPNGNLNIVNNQSFERVDQASQQTESSDRSDLISPDRKLKGLPLILQQIMALYKKRYWNSKRNFKGFFCEIILPAVLIIIAELFISGQSSPPPALVLTPWLYGNSVVSFYANRNLNGSFSEDCLTNMLNETGMGVRCLADDPLHFGTNCSESLLGLLNPNANPHDFEDARCPCELGLPTCPANLSDGELWKYGSVTSDEFYEISDNDIYNWTLRTHDTFKYSRYGGFEFGVHLPSNNTTNESDSNIKIWYDNKAWASSVSYLNAINNVVLRSSLPYSEIHSDQYGITAINHPLDFSNEETQNTDQAVLSAAFAILVIFSMSFIPASSVLFLVEERVSKVKHLQFVSGVKPITFWIASYSWDLINYAIPSFIVIMIFVAFGQWEYVGSRNIGGMILLLLLFGLSSIPLMYPASFLFTVPSTAFVCLACANLFLGTVTTITSFVLQLFDDPVLVAVGDILNQVFLIFPHFCLGRGMIDMSQVYYTGLNYKIIGMEYETNIWDWNYLGRFFTSLIIQAVIFFTFNLALHYPSFFRRAKCCKQGSTMPPLEGEDEDVARERHRVERDDLNSSNIDKLRLCQLTKVYGRHRKAATDRLSFGVRKAECFGLLGVNGAGKTTTFKMLTGEVSVTDGRAFVDGHDITSHLEEARMNLGYCPQEDALLPLLTGLEHLELFASLRGIPKSNLKKVVQESLKKLSLQPYGARKAGTYSGGNKRKLATAIALIGDPAVVFLDEPSSGMDPKARRSLWQVIIDAVKEERSVLLTSHSMEECQVLCTRLAIMVNGTLRCLGSPQHLKNRFGEGYMINVRCEVESAVEVLQSVQSAIPEAALQERRPRQLILNIKLNILPISELFKRMETIRMNNDKMDYSISQTTLDDVFVRFARLQREVQEDDEGLKRTNLQGFDNEGFITSAWNDPA